MGRVYREDHARELSVKGNEREDLHGRALGSMKDMGGGNEMARAQYPGHLISNAKDPRYQRNPKRRNATEVIMAYTKNTSISQPIISLNSSFTTANMAMAQKGWIISVNISPQA